MKKVIEVIFELVILSIIFVLMLLHHDAHGATVPFNQPVNAINLIKDGEGYSATPYFVDGVRHCGWGFNATIHPEICETTDTHAHDVYLRGLLFSVRRTAFSYHHSKVKKVNAIIIDMVYNMGNKINEFEKFKEALQHHDWERAGQELRASRWCEQVGTRCERNALIIEGVDHE